MVSSEMSRGSDAKLHLLPEGLKTPEAGGSVRPKPPTPRGGGGEARPCGRGGWESGGGLRSAAAAFGCKRATPVRGRSNETPETSHGGKRVGVVAERTAGVKPLAGDLP